MSTRRMREQLYSALRCLAIAVLMVILVAPIFWIILTAF